MADDRTERAARNNAIWCQTIGGLHGSPGEFRASLWLNRHQLPSFYPNAVTLTQASGAADQLSGIEELMATAIPGGWSVKDSFRALDLGRLGFDTLFDATWIHRKASAPAPDHLDPDVQWKRVDDEAALAAWELRWRGVAGSPAATGAPRIFLPPLLSDADVAVLAACRERTIIAGAIANQAAGVVGLSNTFHPEGQAVPFWAGFVAATEMAFPGLPMVGYTSAGAIGGPQATGFELLGPLRVWVRSPHRMPALPGS